jgi:hypothetical protein
MIYGMVPVVAEEAVAGAGAAGTVAIDGAELPMLAVGGNTLVVSAGVVPGLTPALPIS